MGTHNSSCSNTVKNLRGIVGRPIVFSRTKREEKWKHNFVRIVDIYLGPSLYTALEYKDFSH